MSGGESRAAYQRRHRVVVKLRGKASDQRCVDCGGQARHWSTVHDRDGMDVMNDYAPRCYPCHSAYDDIARKARATFLRKAAMQREVAA